MISIYKKGLKSGRPLITYQTGENESYLIGTKEQLLDFAKSIVDSVNDTKPDNFFGNDVLASKNIQGCLDGKAEIQLNEVVVVSNEEQKNAAFYSVYDSQ